MVACFVAEGWLGYAWLKVRGPRDSSVGLVFVAATGRWVAEGWNPPFGIGRSKKASTPASSPCFELRALLVFFVVYTVWSIRAATRYMRNFWQLLIAWAKPPSHGSHSGRQHPSPLHLYGFFLTIGSIKSLRWAETLVYTVYGLRKTCWHKALSRTLPATPYWTPL